MQLLKNREALYLLAFIGITLVCGFVYTLGQQLLRMGANDPQIQMAEDAATLLGQGREPKLDAGEVELSRSLAPFLIILNRDGGVITSNAVLDGEPCHIPQGALDWAASHGQNRVTWQPRRGARMALVIVPVAGSNGHLVVAGRSLREVEKRTFLLIEGTAIAWVALMIVSFTSVFIISRRHRHHVNHP
jgi:hypothetical protein